jgi:hypothetical protein
MPQDYDSLTSDVLNGQDCVEVPVFAAWIAPDEHVKKSSLKKSPGEKTSEDEKYAVGISICLTMLIKCVDYYEVLTKVIVEQIMVVKAVRMQRKMTVGILII